MKKMLLLFICFSAVFMTSCWDATELNDVGLVIATGFDLDDDGFDRVTVLSIQPSGNVKEQGGASTTWIGTASGESAFEALRNLRSISTRKLSWMHNKMVVIGKKKAESDIGNIIDLLLRYREMRYDNTIFVTEGTIEELFQVPPALDMSLTRELLGIISVISEWSKGYALSIKDIGVESISEHMQGYVIGNIGFYETERLPVSEKREEYLKMYWKDSPQPIVYIRGAGVIDNNKLVGWLSPEELRGYLIISNKISSGVLETVNVTEKGIDVAVEILHLKSKISFPKVSLDNVTAEVSVEAKCRIQEVKGAAPEHSMTFIELVEEKIENSIATEIYMALESSQNRLLCDFTGFHKEFSAKHKKEWEKLQGNWCINFSRMPITCKVNVDIQNEGLLSRTFKVEGYR